MENKLLQVDALEVPESHGDFARAVAKLADEYGMDRFEMTYRPKSSWPDEDRTDRRISGDMQIRYSSTDGRCRPCKNLSVNINANFSLTLLEQQESCS
jgi:hypothetical protein